MPRKPKGDRAMTTGERKQAQRLRDRRLLSDASVDPRKAPLRILLMLVAERTAGEFAWREIGRRNGWTAR